LSCDVPLLFEFDDRFPPLIDFDEFAEMTFAADAFVVLLRVRGAGWAEFAHVAVEMPFAACELPAFSADMVREDADKEIDSAG